MRYIDHGSGGGPEVLQPRNGPVPEIGAGEVLIEVVVAGVNRPDCLQRSGRYPPPADASPHIGLEVAGRIAAVGQGVTEWSVGDAVCALTNGGGYADYAVAPSGQVLPVPKGLDFVQAAALPETGFTVWANLVERGRLARGETALIHGGSSGIGITAIQVGKALGATVWCTVGTPEKAQACLALGADAAIDYRRQDFVAEAMRLSGNRGVDVILDMVGGPYIEKNLRLLALEGRLVQIAFLQTSRVEIDFLPLMVKRLTYTGSTLRPRTPAEKARLASELRAKLWPMVEDGRVRPSIYKVFPLEQAAQAHALMESSEHIGKIMLQVRPG
ncbi:MAG TPA: NAD(P)H-quinone oxidoreductase [Burkholderiaceae bacterium]|nr:NAD(P)H-quinone oxidoreductase [Burkholderiaceae bacterium]